MIRIKLSTLLGERRMTQAALARATGIRPTTINDMFWGLSDRINIEHLYRICVVLHCEITDILELEIEEDVDISEWAK